MINKVTLIGNLGKDPEIRHLESGSVVGKFSIASNENYKEVLNLAKKAHIALNCRGVTRSDFKFENNKFYLLEINTQPGMTDLSLVPEIAKYVNISFQKLVKNIILSP